MSCKRDTELTDSEKQDVEAINRLYNPENLVRNRYTFPKFKAPSIRIINYESGHIVSMALLVERFIKLQTICKVASIGEVATHPTFQHHGYATEVLQTVTTTMHEQHFAFGVLFCQPKMEEFYKRFGWQRLNNPKILIGPTKMKTRSVNGITMIHFIAKLSQKNLDYLQNHEVFLDEPA